MTLRSEINETIAASGLVSIIDESLIAEVDALGAVQVLWIEDDNHWVLQTRNGGDVGVLFIDGDCINAGLFA